MIWARFGASDTPARKLIILTLAQALSVLIYFGIAAAVR
jgi:hypothetical protein